MLDLTEIPGFLRLFSFKLAVVLDVFSAQPLAARVFLSRADRPRHRAILVPCGRRFGPPRHSVSDQGVAVHRGTFRRALASSESATATER